MMATSASSPNPAPPHNQGEDEGGGSQQQQSGERERDSSYLSTPTNTLGRNAGDAGVAGSEGAAPASPLAADSGEALLVAGIRGLSVEEWNTGVPPPPTSTTAGATAAAAANHHCHETQPAGQYGDGVTRALGSEGGAGPQLLPASLSSPETIGGPHPDAAIPNQMVPQGEAIASSLSYGGAATSAVGELPLVGAMAVPPETVTPASAHTSAYAAADPSLSQTGAATPAGAGIRARRRAISTSPTDMSYALHIMDQVGGFKSPIIPSTFPLLLSCVAFICCGFERRAQYVHSIRCQHYV